MARVIGALNKRGSDGIKLMVGVGVKNPKPMMSEMPKAKGKSSTQGAKPTSRMPKRPTM